ncbi:MAG TPA: hypothetical protein VGP57_19515, partial [Actinoplanes sp.]|nr:hypothetical protein [Actinoplanes sp.]
ASRPRARTLPGHGWAPLFADVLLLDQQTSAAKALGWTPAATTLLEEFRTGSYAGLTGTPRSRAHPADGRTRPRGSQPTGNPAATPAG